MYWSRPHHSWMTTTPGPAPSFAVARYPPAVSPLLGNSTFSPMAEKLPNELAVVPGDHLLDVDPHHDALGDHEGDVVVALVGAEARLVALEEAACHLHQGFRIVDDR